MSVAEQLPPVEPPLDSKPTPSQFNAAPMATLTRTAASPEAVALAQAVLDAISPVSWPPKPGSKVKEATRRDRRAAVTAFLGDLLSARRGGKWAGLVHRSTNSNSFSGEAVSYRHFSAVWKGMWALGWVERWEGHRSKQSFDFDEVTVEVDRSRASRFRATSALLALAERHGITPDDAPSHFRQGLPKKVVRLKSEARRSKGRKMPGRQLPVPKTPEVKAIAAEVHRINAFLAEVRIEGGRHESLFRQFELGDRPEFAWNIGGRLYSAGSSYQTAKEVDRLRMTLNGEAVAEVDVRSSYLTLLHGLTGRPLPPGDDPYAVPGFDRDVVKAWVAAALGSGKPVNRWSPRANKEYAKNKGRTLSDICKAAQVGAAVTLKFPIFKELETLKVSWGALMFYESEAVIGSMVALMEKGIPSLPIHDSLLLPQSAIHLAVEELTARYRTIAGLEPMLTVSVWLPASTPVDVSMGDGDCCPPTPNDVLPQSRVGRPLVVPARGKLITLSPCRRAADGGGLRGEVP